MARVWGPEGNNQIADPCLGQAKKHTPPISPGLHNGWDTHKTLGATADASAISASARSHAVFLISGDVRNYYHTAGSHAGIPFTPSPGAVYPLE